MDNSSLRWFHAIKTILPLVYVLITKFRIQLKTRLFGDHLNHITNCTTNPVYDAGIQTHNLWNMSLLPYPLDQGSRPEVVECSLFHFTEIIICQVSSSMYRESGEILTDSENLSFEVMNVERANKVNMGPRWESKLNIITAAQLGTYLPTYGRCQISFIMPKIHLLHRFHCKGVIYLMEKLILNDYNYS